MTDAEEVLEELDPKPAVEALPVSRRATLQALASVAALGTVGSASAQEPAGGVIAEEAYFSNYDWEPDSDGGTLTIDGDEYVFDGSEEIELPDGSTATKVVLPDGATASEVIGPDGQGLWEGIERPDSTVSRDGDNNSSSITDASGISIETSAEWPEIGAELSSNIGDGATRARVIRVSDGKIMGQSDISSLGAGDTFTIDLDANLTSGDEYNFVCDAEGSSYTQGYDDSASFPYDSDDGNLSIVAGASGETSTTSTTARNIVTVGDVGF